jgi:hypothetical protein
MFGGIHRCVSVAKQRIVRWEWAFLRRQGDADARGDDNVFPCNTDRLSRLDEDTFGQREEVFWPGHIFNDDDELIPTNSCDNITESTGANEAAGHLAQDAVTDLVAEPIIDRLEAVKIDEEQCEPPPRALAATQTPDECFL